MHKFLIHKAGDHVGVATSDIGAGEKVIGVYMDDDSTVEVEALGDVPGLYFMDSPSAAAEHVTLMGSGGAVLHMFPTGQENVIGNPIVPVIKDSGNPNTVRTMSEHIDVDVCGLLSREITLPQAAGDLMTEHLARTANGRLTSAEALGHREFTMTKLYRGAEGLGAPKTTPAHPQSRRDG